MKVAIISPHESGAIDGTVWANLLSRFPEQTSPSAADCIIIPISFYGDFQFRANLPDLVKGKKWVMVDFMEYGLAWNCFKHDTHVWGRNSCDNDRTNNPEMLKFDAFVRENPPITYFKRELLERERNEWLLPVDWPCALPIPGIQTEAEFNTRPIEALHYWGLSHRSRPALHGEIFRHAYTSGYEVIAQFDHWNGFFADPRNRVWASIHAPHFDRKPMQDVLHFVHRSKITVSLPGAGQKCFRDAEAACGSIPAFWNDGIARSYPWDAEDNCILLTPRKEWYDLYDATEQDNLYDLYVSAQDTISRYESERYMREYILPNIERNL